ncbi:MAG: hypothetical protein ACNA8W_02185 [Bradymonadaceae bacterium]
MSLNHVNPALPLLLILIFLFSMGCRESQDDRLRRELELRASQASAQATAGLGYIHQRGPTSSEAGSAIEVRGRNGEFIRVERFFLVTSAIELHGCEAGHDGALGSLRRLLWPISEAHAHVPSSATRLGVPFVEDLIGPSDTARIVGGIAPPPGKYCRMYAILAPADDDVLNLTSASPEEIEDHTLLVEGSWRLDEDTEWTDFRLTSAARIAVEMELIDEDRHEPPLDLSRPGAHALILVEKLVSPELFQDLEGMSIADGTASPQILERLTRTFRMYRYEDPAP